MEYLKFYTNHIYLAIKSSDIKYIIQLISFDLPEKTFNKEYDINPNAIPSVILKDSGMIIMVKKVGIDSV